MQETELKDSIVATDRQRLALWLRADTVILAVSFAGLFLASLLVTSSWVNARPWLLSYTDAVGFFAPMVNGVGRAAGPEAPAARLIAALSWSMTPLWTAITLWSLRRGKTTDFEHAHWDAEVARILFFGGAALLVFFLLDLISPTSRGAKTMFGTWFGRGFWLPAFGIGFATALAIVLEASARLAIKLGFFVKRKR